MIPIIIKNLERVRTSKPLIHHLTNYVTVNDCANITLQIGGLPVMADAIKEVAEMQQIANALVLNIGTLNTGLVKSMIAAGREILTDVKVDIIKGNLAEIGVLAGLEATVRGVEAGEVSGDIIAAAQNFAGTFGFVMTSK